MGSARGRSRPESKTILNTQTGSEEGSGKADIVVPEGEQEEAGKSSDSPYGHVGDDTAGEGMAVGHDGTVPEDHEEGNGQRHGRDGEVDQPRGSAVAEVDGSQIEEVGDEDDFGEDDQVMAPKQQPSELEDVVPGRGVGVRTGSSRKEAKSTHKIKWLPTAAAELTTVSSRRKRCQMYTTCRTQSTTQ